MDYSKAKRLLQELKESKYIPIYNDNLLNELVEDINKYYHEIQSNSEDFKKEKEDKSLDQYKTPYIMTLFEIIKRVIRIVLAYLLIKLKETFWENNGIIPKEKLDVLGKEEQEFIITYKQLNIEYQQSFKIDIDLTKDMHPPTSLYVEIRVLQDCGSILTADATTLILNRGATLFVKRQDVEHLIKSG